MTAKEEYDKWVEALNLPVGGVHSVEEFATAVGRWRPVSDNNTVFRGEACFYDSYCTSKIRRHPNFDEFVPLSELVKSFRRGTETILLREELDILNSFSQWFIQTFPTLRHPPPSATAWLDLAQHYGAPTRLLDVSTNPLTALFFACWSFDDGCRSKVDGLVWVKEAHSSVRTQSVPRNEFLPSTGPETEQGIADNIFDFFEPWPFSISHQNVNHFYSPIARDTEINKRIQAQSGKLIWSSDCSKNPQWFPILVPGSAKPGILRQLNDLYVNPIILFPDEAGSIYREQFLEWMDTGLVSSVSANSFSWSWPGKLNSEYSHLIR